jgi:hypothetical protein
MPEEPAGSGAEQDDGCGVHYGHAEDALGIQVRMDVDEAGGPAPGLERLGRTQLTCATGSRRDA